MPRKSNKIKPAKTGKKQGNRDEKGRFKKGFSGNIDGGGRPKGNASIAKLIKIQKSRESNASYKEKKQLLYEVFSILLINKNITKNKKQRITKRLQKKKDDKSDLS